MICQKHFTKLQKMKKTQSKIKPIKIGKKPGTMQFWVRRLYAEFQATRSENDKYSTQRKISLCCLLIKEVKVFKAKNELTTDLIKRR